MTLDADGNIVACAGFEESGPGPMIYVFSPTGRVLETHPHACRPAHQLLLRGRGHADSVRDHRRRPSVPCLDGPHRLDNVAVTSILERLRRREIVDIQP